MGNLSANPDFSQGGLHDFDTNLESMQLCSKGAPCQFNKVSYSVFGVTQLHIWPDPSPNIDPAMLARTISPNTLPGKPKNSNPCEKSGLASWTASIGIAELGEGMNAEQHKKKSKSDTRLGMQAEALAFVNMPLWATSSVGRFKWTTQAKIWARPSPSCFRSGRREALS